MKRCTHCKQEKPTSEFNCRHDRPAQLQPWCKKCKRAYDAMKMREKRALRRSGNDRVSQA